MALAKVEEKFQLLNEAIELLQENVKCSALDALIETFENLLDNGRVHVEDGAPDEATVAKLKDLYQKIDLASLSKEERRSVLQLCLLQAYKREKVQANHQMTPDTIGFLLAYLIEKVGKYTAGLKLLDLTVGTGNLLSAILSTLKKSGWKELDVYGVDNDDTMLALANISAELMQSKTQLVHQDVLAELQVPPADIVVADLPIGYYPLDSRVREYQTSFAKGHSYVHYLLIEQALEQLVAGGWGVFVVPRGMFEAPEAKQLLQVIQAKGYLQGLLNLPQPLFINENSQKSILLLQKKGPHAKQAEPILLGEFPLMKNQLEFVKFMQEIDNWQAQNFA